MTTTLTNSGNSFFEDFTADVGRSWNRFWFTPADPLPLCVLRIGVGLSALAYFLSLCGDLTRWFASDGLLPPALVEKWLAASLSPDYHFSVLNSLSNPGELWAIHTLAMVATLFLAAGLFTRVSSIVTLALLLSYIHRAPMISGHQEPVLAFLLFYLCLAPAGKYLSVDAWLTRFRKQSTRMPCQADSPNTVAAAVPLRLIQVHLAAFYAMLAITKLNGDAWWNGEAIWMLLAQTYSRPLDLAGLRDQVFLINAWTHAIIVYEFLFPVLIWNRLARPILLVVGAIFWLSLALATGLMLFCLTMLVANIVFVSPAWLRRFRI